MAVKKLGDVEGADVPMTSAHAEDMRPVVLPTGSVHHIYKGEVDSFQDRMTKYMRDNSFVNQSDLMDFERLMLFETLALRWSQWLFKGSNYWGDKIDDKLFQGLVQDLSKEIRSVKQSLTIDKLSRDKQRSVDDVSQYIQKLLFRAKHFGYKRNDEFAQIMEIFQDLRAKIGLYERCDERDRQEQKANLEDIYQWLVAECFPKLDEIDRKFRQETPKGLTGLEAEALDGGQRMYVQEN